MPPSGNKERGLFIYAGDRAGLLVQTEHIHAAPSLDDFVILKSVDSDALERNHFPNVCHGGNPTGGHLIALSNLILDRYLKIGVDFAILLDQFLHSRQSISAIRVIGIVMYNIWCDECVESIEIPTTPDLECYS
jgi:hypothetical protein